MNTILKSTKNILIPFIALISFGLQAENKVDNIEIKRAIYPDKGQKDNSDDIIMIDENGKKVALSELKGKVVFVNCGRPGADLVLKKCQRLIILKINLGRMRI